LQIVLLMFQVAFGYSMKMKKLILVGGGGHCKAAIDVIESTGEYEIIGILDASKKGQNVLGYPVIGSDHDIVLYINLGYYFLVTLGQIKSAEVRKRIFELITEHKGLLATVVSKWAYLSKHAKIGKGSIVMHHATINAGAHVGDNCIINSGCLVEHDCVVGNHVHLSTFSVINGGCSIEDEVFIGSNVTLANNLNIAKGVVIGAGSVVIKNVKESGIYVGNPITKKYDYTNRG